MRPSPLALASLLPILGSFVPSNHAGVTITPLAMAPSRPRELIWVPEPAQPVRPPRSFADVLNDVLAPRKAPH